MIAWLTLAVAVVAALASAFSAWRSWLNWRADRLSTRFERAVDRALSDDARTSETGIRQVVGMYGRHELSARDRAYVRDRISGILDLAAVQHDAEVVVQVSDADKNEDEMGEGGSR